jgi:hypothetical protein
MILSFRRWLLRRIWYVYPHLTLLINLPADEVVSLLEEAARPSKDRLHLQEIFLSGRRYLLEKRKGGFTLLTTSKSYWRYTEGLLGIRRRTRSAAKMVTYTVNIDAGYTRMEVRQHIRLGYLIDILWIPLFLSTIMLGVPWPWWTGVVMGVILLGLSYGYHYYNAAFQANEMAFFLLKVLREHMVTDLPELAPSSSNVMYSEQSFTSEWEKFYQSRRRDR